MWCLVPTPWCWINSNPQRMINMQLMRHACCLYPPNSVHIPHCHCWLLVLVNVHSLHLHTVVGRRVVTQTQMNTENMKTHWKCGSCKVSFVLCAYWYRIIITVMELCCMFLFMLCSTIIHCPCSHPTWVWQDKQCCIWIVVVIINHHEWLSLVKNDLGYRKKAKYNVSQSWTAN